MGIVHKILVTCLLFFFSQVLKAQQPAGLPITKSKGWIEYGYLQNDSGRIDAKRDTSWTPRFAGTSVYWENPGVDTFFWTFNGKTSASALKWDRQGAIFSNGGTVGDSLLMNPAPSEYLFKNLVNGSGISFNLSDTTITISAAGYDATVDFSVNANPNTGGTTFSPNTPQLTTVIYVSTINGSQWTWNGTLYVLYVPPNWTTLGNAGTTPGTHFIGTTDNKGLMIKTNNIQSGYIDLAKANTSFGQSTLISVTSGGNFNSAFGYFSLNTNTTGSENTAVGYRSMRLNTTGGGNVAIGINALEANTTASRNVAIGYHALLNTTTGNLNTAIGGGQGGVMEMNTTGARNVAVGYNSMRFFNSDFNTALGYGALNGTTATVISPNTGAENTAVGHESLFFLTTGGQNTVLGRRAGYSTTTGSNNVFLGDSAGFYNTTASNQIIINTLDRVNYAGDQTGSPVYIQQNTTVASQLITLNGKTGINTIAPSASLSIAETALGVTPDNTKGLFLLNSTSAANGAQQISPAAHWQGQGWKTNATAASQPIDFRAYVLPVQGISIPSGIWRLDASQNSSSYTTKFGVSTFGELFLYDGTTSGTPGTAGYLLASSGPGAQAYWTAPPSFTLTNGSGTTANGTAEDLGGTMTNNAIINFDSYIFEISSSTIGAGLLIDPAKSTTTIGDVNKTVNGTNFVVDDAHALGYFTTNSLGGFFGINKIAPTVALDVVGDMKLIGSTNSSLETPADFNIGDISNNVYIQVSGNANSNKIIMHGTGIQFADFGAGALTTDGSGNIAAVSDSSYKKILGDSYTGLDAILQLNPKVFTWNKGSGYNMNDINTGFIAQDVKRLIPNATGVTKDGHLTLIDRPITAALVRGEQELYGMIIRMQQEIDQLKIELQKK